MERITVKAIKAEEGKTLQKKNGMHCGVAALLSETDSPSNYLNVAEITDRIVIKPTAPAKLLHKKDTETYAPAVLLIGDDCEDNWEEIDKTWEELQETSDEDNTDNANDTDSI